MSPDDRVVADVAEVGWHVVKVLADSDAPEFAFSIGLTKTFGHPEVIIFGLPLETMHAVLNNIGELARDGRRFEPGDTTDDLLDGYSCEFLRVPTSAYQAFLGYACWFYDGESFDVIQCVWPDRQNRFPWDADVVEAVRKRQQLLGPREA